MNLLDDTIRPDLKIKGITFIFGQVDLIVKKKSWFTNQEIKRLSYKSISSLKLIKPSEKDGFLFQLIINFIIGFIIGDLILSFKRHILINYHIGEDEAVFRLDIKTSDSEFKELKSTLVTLKH